MSDAAQNQSMEEKIEKGKGKMAEQDPMEEDDESSSEEETEDQNAEIEEPDEDNMEEIDADNIMGSRTRGKNIDYAQAAKELEAEGDEEDEEDDEDFIDEDDQMRD